MFKIISDCNIIHNTNSYVYDKVRSFSLTSPVWPSPQFSSDTTKKHLFAPSSKNPGTLWYGIPM